MVGIKGRPVAFTRNVTKSRKKRGTRPLDILQTRRCQPGANIGQIIIKANRRSDSEKETMSADAGIIWQFYENFTHDGFL